MADFADVTLLITHYNRSLSLGRLLRTFRAQGVRFGAIVVSDDASAPLHRAELLVLQQEYGFTLVTTEQNKGLGNNINKGQDAVTSEYTLYVQEDFEPAPIFSDHFAQALSFMKQDYALDIVRFYAYFPYPNMKPYGKGYAEMKFSPFDMNHLKFYFYSDHPHLRRSNFFTKFGRYPEGEKGDRTEFAMALSFLRNKAKGLFYTEYTTLFYQKNTSDEPSTMNRADWRESENFLIKAARWVYLRFRWLKNSGELYFGNTTLTSDKK